MAAGTKKKIAVFASGWASQILSQFIIGLSEYLSEYQADLYLFMCYPSYADSEDERNGGLNIMKLPDLHDFDAAIIVSNGLEFPEVVESLHKRCLDAQIPVISLGVRKEGCYFVGVENYQGMHDLAEYLVHDCEVKTCVFMAGSEISPDSQERLSILTDVLQEHGCTLLDVRYTNWVNNEVRNQVRDYLGSGKPLPDVFVCANDGIAMNTCLELGDAGIQVPEDTYVTGFDDLFDAQIFYPSITSVDQNFPLLGRESGKLLVDLWNGKPRDKELIVPCSFVPSESTGNFASRYISSLRRNLARDSYMMKSEETNLDSALNRIEHTIMSGTSFGDLSRHLQRAFERDRIIDTPFNVILEESYKDSLSNPEVKFRTEGYGDEMYVLYSSVDPDGASIRPLVTLETRKLIPSLDEDGENHSYIFLPISEGKCVYGYFSIEDKLNKINSHFFKKFQSRLSLILERFRQKLNVDELNRRLTELTRTDALTHIKNRTAWEIKAEELEWAIKNRMAREFGIIMFDVNNLKGINDRLGHDAGDEYIINAARLICHTFKHSPVYRIGGDEFLAVVTGDDYNERFLLIMQAGDEMARLEVEATKETERVSCACGLADYDPEKDKSVVDVFKRADALMYENKRIMKGDNIR